MSKKLFTSLEKALDILCSFDLDNLELSAQELSQMHNLPLSTTYRYLEILIKREFLSRNPTSKKFCLGYSIFKLGSIFASQLSLLEVAYPEMQKLSKIFGEFVFLTVINGWESICIEKIEATKPIRVSLRRGATVPLHASASSKPLLAYQSNSFLEKLIEDKGLQRFTEKTIIDPVELKDEIKRIKKQGYAFSDSEIDEGVRAVGAPIFNYKALVVACLSIASPAVRMPDKKIKEIARVVKESAEEISQKMGYVAKKNKAN